MPLRTSPEPAVASVGGALVLMIARPIRGRDHGVGAFKNDDGAAAPGGAARASELVAARVEQRDGTRLHAGS